MVTHYPQAPISSEGLACPFPHNVLCHQVPEAVTHPALSLHDAARHFCDLSNDIICKWMLQDRLSKHWQEDDTLKASRLGHFFPYINGIMIDGWFMSVARLHDPSETNGYEDLSVGFVLKHPKLDPSTRIKLEHLTQTMEAFAKFARKPRNKLLAHNDVKSMVAIESLGVFPPGDDINYLALLRRFAEILSEDIFNEPFVCDDLVSNDVDAVVSVLALGIKAL